MVLKQIHKIVLEFAEQVWEIKKKRRRKIGSPSFHIFDSKLTGRAEINGTHHSKSDRPREA